MSASKFPLEMIVNVRRLDRYPACQTLVALCLTVFCAGCASPPETSNASGYQRTYNEGNYPAFDPVVLSPALIRTLEDSRPGEFVPALVRLDYRPNLFDHADFRNASTKAEQRAAAIDYLQTSSADSQGNLLQAVRQMAEDGLVRNIQPLWIANAVCLEVTREAITYLSEFQEIDYIAGTAKMPLFMADPSWNVKHVNSPQVWQRAAGAIRGSGVVVAVIDSGVDLSHSDLDDRIWINGPEDIDGDGRLTRQDANGIDDDGNGWIDDVVGWDFESGDNDPSPGFFEFGRDGGHGTQVAGIIAGDGEAGLATGIAPGAELMVLKIDSQVAAWQAMQYALVNGADIINLSLGWSRSMSPDAASWRDAVDNATDAGVLVVAASGNGGTAPMVHAVAPGDITLPGSVPRALTVSAVAAPSDTDWLDPIATFSAAGPVSWQSVRSYEDYPYPPGLMKPDLTAPGIDVRSTTPGGGYATLSGSSMAAAHVSGAAALLLETSPSMQPHELTYVLRETAWRFTDPNDVRGWGRLDAYNAVNYHANRAPFDLTFGDADSSWNSDSVWIDNNHDGVHDQLIPGGTNRVFARVRNRGGQAVGNTELRFYYAPAGTLGAAPPTTGGRESEYRYIGSYFVPVTGPKGSSQEAFTGAVEWVAPEVDGPIGHWALAVEAVTVTPVNDVESETTNNFAVRNHYEIVMAPGQTSVFNFNIYRDTEHRDKAVDLELIRSGGVEDFQFDLALNDDESPLDYEGLQALANSESRASPGLLTLMRDRARLTGLSSVDGEQQSARLILRAPDVDNLTMVDNDSEPVRITIVARNEFGPAGRVTIDVRLDPDAAKLNRVIYAQK